MLTVESLMFVTLGFLCAVLLGFIVAPAYWARAVRLTTERMPRSLPLTELEIRAERDRLRAENAIRVHRLSSRLERARLADARQRVEINRRDALVSSLERKLQRVETELEASDNARRVLEATITDRVPKVEARLLEARQLLAQRDQEVKALNADTSKTFRALDDAMQMNAQQRAEIERLKASAARGGFAAPVDRQGESAAALRSEVEALRARSRDQAALIVRLQEAIKAGGMGDDASVERREQEKQLSKELENAASALSDAQIRGGASAVEVATLKRKIEDQAGEIGKLTAALQAYEEEAAGRGQSLSLRDTKAAMRSRLSATEKELEQLRETVAKLRRELVTANERIARQASHYMDELRRLGSGRGGMTGNPTTGRPAGNGALAQNGSGSQNPVAAGDAAPDSDEVVHDVLGADVEHAAAGIEDAGDAEPVASQAAEPQKAETTRPSRRKLMDRIAGLAKP